MADVVSGGTGPTAKAWGGAVVAWSAAAAAAGRAKESERERERVSELRVSGEG